MQRQITFAFAGGPHDGRLARCRLGDGGEAERLYLLTNHGTPGFLFKVASDYAAQTLAREGLAASRRLRFQKHFYVVTGTVEHDGGVRVRADYATDPVTAEGRRA